MENQGHTSAKEDERQLEFFQQKDGKQPGPHQEKIKNYLYDKLKNIQSDTYPRHESLSLLSRFPSNLINTIHKDLLKEIQVINNLRNNPSIETLIKSFSDITPFQGIQLTQILVHKMGEVSVDNFVYENGKFYSVVSEVKQFNLLYQKVKKSKSKHFIKGDDHEMVRALGNYFAEELDFQDYKVIIILSRNEFLPSLEDEKSVFGHAVSSIAKPLEFILSKESLEDRDELLMTVFDQFHLSLKITKPDKTVIYQNREGTYNESEPLSKILAPLKVYTSAANKNESTQQKFHFLRVNLLGELLNTLKHELSNPLYGIKLMTEILEEDFDDKDCNEIVSEILINYNRCQTIIDNFLDIYSKDISNGPVNLYQLINEVLKLTKSQTRGISKEFIADDKDLIVNSNKITILQIIFNLIINAAQALHSKNIPVSNPSITLKVLSDSKNAIVMIKDNGPGIPEDIQSKIFDPFFTTKSKGTGLGLSICKKFADNINASIDFSSSEEEGTTFTLAIPLNESTSS